MGVAQANGEKKSGKVIWFDAREKKYGFIDVDGSADNLFVHLSDVVRAHIDEDDMKVGTKIKFRVVPSPKDSKKFCAVDLELA